MEVLKSFESAGLTCKRIRKQCGLCLNRRVDLPLRPMCGEGSVSP